MQTAVPESDLESFRPTFRPEVRDAMAWFLSRAAHAGPLGEISL